MLCGLTGCAFGRKEKEIDPKRSPHDYVRQVLQNIQDYLKEGDADSLCAMFADYYNVTLQEVQGMMNFIDGKIVSFDNNSIRPGAKEVYYGEYKLYSYGGRFTFSTNTGTEYKGYFAGYAVYNEEPEKVGLEDIYIENLMDTSLGYGLGSYQSVLTENK